MLYRAILLSSALLTLSIVSGSTTSAFAQTNSDVKPVSQHVDTASVYSLSIADLEMIMPEKRLRPEADPNPEGPVVSPFSHDASKRPDPSAVMTEADIENLESIEAPEEAADAPSR
ncbi:MAG TPA: hypothetical protein VFH43_04775 [Candidatus Kapabacteria bacterium]|nr:hypothetical protein [Candidatus Kapabacteria bacterium]